MKPHPDPCALCGVHRQADKDCCGEPDCPEQLTIRESGKCLNFRHFDKVAFEPRTAILLENAPE